MVFKPGVDELEGVLVRRDGLGDLFLEQVGTVSETEQRQGEYEYRGRSDEVYVLLMLGVADLIECINQGVIVVRLECNVEVDCGAGGRAIKTLPVCRDVCFTRMSPRSDARGVPKLAKGNAERIQNTECQRWCMITWMPAARLPGIPVGFQGI
jgi:hypothetical protein